MAGLKVFVYIMRMAKETKKPDIYRYFNYREYLSALFDYHKAQSPVFSHRYIVSKAGFKSPNSLKNVINGERNLSVEGAERFAKAFKMEDDERTYFLKLVKFNLAKSQSAKERHLSELFTLRKSCSPASLDEDQMEILSAWWHLAVREITALPDYKNSSLWISRILEPPIDRHEAAQSMELLKKLGFIQKGERGWEPVDKTIQTDPEVLNTYAQGFHRDMIKLGMEAISRFSHEFREISGTTLRISRNDIPRVKTMLQNFRRQLLDFAENSQDADQVYQLNFQFFPLIKPDRPQRLKEKRKNNEE